MRSAKSRNARNPTAPTLPLPSASLAEAVEKIGKAHSVLHRLILKRERFPRKHRAVLCPDLFGKR
jgi:hypothetical protein